MFSKKSAWGIEIGTASLKAAKLSLEGDTPVLVDWALIDYPGVEDSDEARLAASQAALQEFVKSHKVRPSDVTAVAVPGRSVFSKFIKLPPVEKKRIPEIVKYESRQQIPFPIDDVVWGFQPTQEETPPGEEVEVGIFAIRREIVQEKMGLLYQAGIRPSIVQGGNLALFNYLSYGHKLDGAVIVVDMGAEAADLVIIQPDRFWLRNLPTGGTAVTKKLQERLQLAFKDAEKLKREAAHSKQAEKLLGMMKPAIAGVLREIQMSLGFYKSQRQDIRFTKCYVSGRGFLLKGLTEAVSEGIQVPLSRFSALEGIQAGPTVNPAELAKGVDRLGVPLGLALQGLGLGRLKLNLVPPEVMRAKRSSERKPYALAASLFVFLAVLFFYLKVAGVTREAMGAGKRSSELVAALERQDLEIRQAREDELLSYKFADRIERQVLREIRADAATGFPHDQYLKILQDVIARILTPGEVWIDGIEIDVLDHPRAKKADFPAGLPRRLLRVTLAANTSPQEDQNALYTWIEKRIIAPVSGIPSFDCTARCDRMVAAGVLTPEDVEALRAEVGTLTRDWDKKQKEGGVDSFKVSWLVVPPKPEEAQ